MNPGNDQQGQQQGSQGQKQGDQQQQFQSGQGQHGEGNYEATRKYNAGLKDHVEHHDIEKEARDAAPKSAAEAKEMEEAERIGKSRAKGDDSQSEGNGMDGQDGGEK